MILNYLTLGLIDEIQKSKNSIHKNKKLQEFLKLRESIESRIEEIEDFYEKNFGEPNVLNFQEGRMKLKQLLLKTPDSYQKNAINDKNNYKMDKNQNNKKNDKLLNNDVLNNKFLSNFMIKNKPYNNNFPNLSNNFFFCKDSKNPRNNDCTESDINEENNNSSYNYEEDNYVTENDYLNNDNYINKYTDENDKNDENSDNEINHNNSKTIDKPINNINNINNKDENSKDNRDDDNEFYDNIKKEETNRKMNKNQLREITYKFILNEKEYFILIREKAKNVNPLINLLNSGEI